VASEQICIHGFVWASQGNIPLGRPSHGWKHSFTMEIKEIGFGGGGLD